MRMAALQLGGCTEDLARNEQATCAALQAAAKAGLRLAVLP
jgi:predicted amidohydrolase